MKERPILFSAPMVRSILAGTKTQTRRAIKGDLDDEARLHVGMYHPTVTDRHGEEQPGPEVFGAWTTDGEWAMRCPYGQPGDRLWVRETFAHMYRGNARPEMRRSDDVVYAADGFTPDEYVYGTWKPSIHMPRWASRILLEVTAVKVERLQDISEADAQAEGLIAHRKGGWHWEQPPAGIEGTNHFGFKTARNAYQVIWESINGDGSWDANPWVWCVSFKRLEAA